MEEPTFHDEGPRCDVIADPESGVQIVVPRLQHGTAPEDAERLQRVFLDHLIESHEINNSVAWYYTPMMLGFSAHLRPRVTVYDCMDELSLFRGAPPALREREADLFRRADLVFTGGQSLYEAKRTQHRDVHCLPSSVDVAHFAQALAHAADPADQASIPHPRIGYCGVIDERMDLDLIAGVASVRPDWHLVMLGPVVKIDPEALPKNENIHWLGGKKYAELPAYMSGWDAAMLPFAHNESTRFISPTKTPEYLSAGLPAVSTSIRDVVRPYGEQGLVQIADTPEAFVSAVERAFAQRSDAAWARQVQQFLSGLSWDSTQRRMANLILSKTEAESEQAVA
ncbi:MAG TPA: glycosyltransferase [Bryobacteraceae bacterium]|nr:glycosyltransferase [Bryobacteraceae bacterium]